MGSSKAQPAICSHLQVVFNHLRQVKKAEIVRVELSNESVCFFLSVFLHWSDLKKVSWPEGWDVIKQVYPTPGAALKAVRLREKEIKSPTRILFWGYADPHWGNGNSIACRECGCVLEARFDASDPQGTMGD